MGDIWRNGRRWQVGGASVEGRAERRSYVGPLRNVRGPALATADSILQGKEKIRAAHAKEKQQIQKRATTRIALT